MMGGFWSDVVNWDGGVIGDGVNSVLIFGNFDLLVDNIVIFDFVCIIGGFMFGDVFLVSLVSWIIIDGGDFVNVFMFDVILGNVIVMVGVFGIGVIVMFDVFLVGFDGFVKVGVGIFVIVKFLMIIGGVNVGVGILCIGIGGMFVSIVVMGIFGFGI